MFTCNATFHGEEKQELRLASFLKQALMPGDASTTLRNSFDVTVLSVDRDAEGLAVSYECSNQGKAFLTWAAKECSLDVEAVLGTTSGGLEDFSFSSGEPKPNPQQQAAVKQMEVESQRVWNESKAAQRSGGSAADAALQTMLDAAKAEGIAEGKFQILKNVMNSCDTLEVMLRITGVDQQEFVELFNKFNKRGN